MISGEDRFAERGRVREKCPRTALFVLWVRVGHGRIRLCQVYANVRLHTLYLKTPRTSTEHEIAY